MLKKVLVVGYSQTGQLRSIINSFTIDIVESPSVDVDFVDIELVKPYSFPWSVLSFFDVMAESVLMIPPEIEMIELNDPKEYDLVILAYQVWYLSPSLPMTAFLKSPIARDILKNTPVITLIGCRNMWLMAQEEMKRILQSYNSNLIDNVVLTDNSGSLLSFITTPRWMFTGKKNAFWKVFPVAGVSRETIHACNRFGKKIRDGLLCSAEKQNKPLLTQMGAVIVDERLISSEVFGKKSFKFWAKIIRMCGNPGSKMRIPVIVMFITTLCVSIVTIVPISMMIKTVIRFLTKNKKTNQQIYFEQPSDR